MQVRIAKQDTEVSAIDARRQFGELMNRAYYGGESFVVKRDDLPMIRITPLLPDSEKEASRQRFFAFVDRVRLQLAKSDRKVVDEAFAEALEAAHSPT
jgi:antitoxin (DNA-binding transcriptional repressor) of toxin-antitoxin stability system